MSEAAEKGLWVLHAETGTVGKMSRYWTGNEGDKYVSPHDGSAVVGPVLELDTGDAFFVRGPDTFVPLTQAEIALYASYQQMVTAATEIAARQAAAARVARESFQLIASSALRLQQRLLATTPSTPPEGVAS